MTAATMRAVRAGWLALLFCVVAAVLTPFARADVTVPALTGRVVDQTGTLSEAAVARLDQKLKAFEARKGSQIAVLIVPTTQPEAIEQFSIRVAEAWKIGRKKVDDGAILLVAKNDRKLRIEVGYGLEGALPDVTAKRIIDEIIPPKFKAGDFDGGIEAGVDRMIGVIDGEPLPTPQPQHEWAAPESMDELTGWAIPLLFGTLVLNGFLKAALGRVAASGLTGIIVGAVAMLFGLVWYIALVAGFAGFLLALVIDLFGGPTISSGRRGGWSGGTWTGGSSGSSWSSGSSDSGFSGGGGSFGGGGASGSW
ncbi:YgcG family protein [Rhodopseudomonas sp. BR0C11]|uniref:TPM domain-containing protein n=1 Tax=Rhodopseudomonas sp. BR0C11 TaxID=2269370 RepID=UPI0013DE9EE0|nr:YgcG family protein [Rhodopseudomonas sp. BR0C11]NEV78764.1 YgcG family protein [Rhodopseudomonas sp. BR0C11]